MIQIIYCNLINCLSRNINTANFNRKSKDDIKLYILSKILILIKFQNT